MGDAVLVEIAARLTEAVREVDTVARYGGEEFCLLLPRTNIVGARLLAEKVRSAVADRPFTLHDARRTTLDVTASIGVATHPAHGDSLASLLTAVDAALYRAKGAGKNRVVVAEGSEAVVER
jgi:diguanylate cyclase (GGDEF)-like protein